ncbi:hypothetical protein MU582_03835 [Nocardioidaceae bacterium SCSIO 66511]|nr:hypothetical protein MU582_03835 [Nocardioidaceae bacterium SCSIO 66511]
MRTAVPPQFSADDLQQLLTIELTQSSGSQGVRNEAFTGEPTGPAPTPSSNGTDGWDWTSGSGTA